MWAYLSDKFLEMEKQWVGVFVVWISPSESHSLWDSGEGRSAPPLAPFCDPFCVTPLGQGREEGLNWLGEMNDNFCVSTGNETKYPGFV